MGCLSEVCLPAAYAQEDEEEEEVLDAELSPSDTEVIDEEDEPARRELPPPLDGIETTALFPNNEYKCMHLQTFPVTSLLRLHLSRCTRWSTCRHSHRRLQWGSVYSLWTFSL